VRSVAGGFSAWKRDGLDVEVPESLSARERERYGRHLRMPEVGEAGQLRLRRTSMLLLGAGGLGSPAALYLAAAGIGRLRLVDDDAVDRSNLQRQILFAEECVGRSKAEQARERLLALNPDIQVEARAERMRAANVEELLSGIDIVVDGSDNFAARYLLNDACVKHGIPCVHGSIYRFEGQVSVFDTRSGGPCYRCLYPEPPPPELAPSCAEAGVLGVLPGIVGCLQAVEAIKLALGHGRPLVGRLLHYDASEQTFTELEVAPDPGCPACGPEAGPIQLADLIEGCAS
jgi:molybdopterin/thiamine biosynthesis adenylyltransferase